MSLGRSEGIKLNENKAEWRHQSGTKRPFNAVLTVPVLLINEMNDKIGPEWLFFAVVVEVERSFYFAPKLPG